MAAVADKGSRDDVCQARDGSRPRARALDADSITAAVEQLTRHRGVLMIRGEHQRRLPFVILRVNSRPALEQSGHH